MAFTQFKLDVATVQARGIFNNYVYEPANGDALADVIAANYFSASRFVGTDGWEGGIIGATLSDGHFVLEIQAGGGTATQVTSSSSAAGSDTEVQFNDGGSFAGNSSFTFNKTTLELILKNGQVMSFNKTEVIKTAADLPAPVANVITLDDFVAYIFNGLIDIGDDNIVTGINNVILSHNNPFNAILLSTTTAALVSGEDVNFFSNGVSFSGANSSAIFDFKNTAGNEKTSVFSIQSFLLIAGTKVARFENMAVESMFSGGAAPGASFANGIEVVGPDNGDFFIDMFIMPDISGTGIAYDLGTAVFDAFQVSDTRFASTATNVFISGAAGNANMTAGSIGRVIDNRISGAIANPPALVGITRDDEQWLFTANEGIEDTNPDSFITMITNATVTTITDANPTLISGTFSEESTSQFTTTAAGRITYNGVNTITIPVDFNCSIEPDSGNNKDLSIYVAKNGTALTNSRSTVRADTTNPLAISNITQVTFANGDFVEPFTSNDTDFIDILITRAKFRVN